MNKIRPSGRAGCKSNQLKTGQVVDFCLGFRAGFL